MDDDLIEEDMEGACTTLGHHYNGRNLTLLVIIWSVVLFNYYLINMNAKEMSGGIYKNNLAIAVSSLCGCLSTRKLLDYVSTKNFIIVYFGLAFIVNIAQILIEDEQNSICLTFLSAFVIYSNFTAILYC